MNILLTGANGFVGSALLKELTHAGHYVFALVRKKNNQKNSKKITWIEGDLLIPESLPELKEISRAYYLVHGLKEDAQSFEYDEAMAAVNFINWLRPTGAGIIYLGGLGPRHEKLSPHLRSRHLTGAILGSSGLGTIEFRASIVLGEGSTSFEMVKAIAERLPFRPEISLLNKPCQPLSLKDLLNYLMSALDISTDGHRIYEIGGPDITSYGELLDIYSELAGLKRKKIKIPEVEAKVLMKALDYSIPEHAKVGKKLTESLDHPTIVTDDSATRDFPTIRPENIRVAMDLAQSASQSHYAPLWEKEFLKGLLSDKLLVQSGLLSPELLRNLEKVGRLRDIFSRK